MAERRRGRAGLWVIAAWGVCAGCSGLIAVMELPPQCRRANEACLARCGDLVDPANCEQACAFEAHSCSERSVAGEMAPGHRNTATTKPTHTLELKAGHASARGADGVSISAPGAQRAADGVFLLHPGEAMTIRVGLMAGVGRAELLMQHGCDAAESNCRVSVDTNKGHLLGAYQPPRRADRSLSVERFDLMPHLPAPKGGWLTVELEIRNRPDSGSAYRIGDLKLIYRDDAPPPKRPGNIDKKAYRHE